MTYGLWESELTLAEIPDFKACARAPVRVDPAGGGTDAPPFCIDYGGAVLNFAVERHAFATAQRLQPGSGVIIRAMDVDRTVVADGVAQLVDSKELGFLKAFVLRLVPAVDSLLLMTETDVPPGSGLGGSGALGVAIVAAIDLLYGRVRSPLETAQLANDVERNDLGYPGGSQDSYAAALGGFHLLRYERGGGMTARPLQISEPMCRRLEHDSLLIYCGASHVSASIHEDIKRSYHLAESPTVRAMLRLRSLAEQMAEALEADDLPGYAETLSDSCRELYNLHESCDSAEHRQMFAAIDDCILGGKTCGAGGGGFMVVLTQPGRRRECILRAEALGGTVWPVTIDFRGLQSWREPRLAPDRVSRLRQSASSPESEQNLTRKNRG